MPDDLKKNRIPMYESDEGLRRARRPFVDQACGRQFRKDFTTFLKTRAQELVSMGQMVLCMVGRPSSDNDYLYIQPWDAPFIPLNDMASRVRKFSTICFLCTHFHAHVNAYCILRVAFI